jgi:hypothetical protein
MIARKMTGNQFQAALSRSSIGYKEFTTGGRAWRGTTMSCDV